MIVRWGLASVRDVLAELGVERPLLITTARWDAVALPVARRFAGVRSHAEIAGVRAATEAAEDADGLVALGGGSAIDTAKAVSVERELPLVSIPTTYSGAEWTVGFGVRDAASRIKSGATGALVRGIVYEPELTLGLPRDQSAGTAMNALAHCAEALYTAGHSEERDRHAIAGAGLISRWLPAVADNGRDRQARRGLLEGAMHAGAALQAGMGVAHAVAQALGARFGLAHGAMNAVSLGPALRFNREAAPEALIRFGKAMGREDPIARVDELAALAGPTRLRDHGVPREELPAVAELAASRPAARGNPRPVTPDAVLGLLEQAW
jgi:maleylacetate reductase